MDLIRVKANVLSKIKLRYFQVSFSYRIGPSKRVRSKGRGLKFLIDLEKWKISDFSCLTISVITQRL